MKNILSLLFALILLASCKTGSETNVEDQAITNTQDGKVLLRLRPEVGKEYITRISANISSENSENPLDMVFNMDMNLNVEDQVDSIFNYVASISHLDMKMDIDGMGLTYNSDEENTGLAAAFASQFDTVLNEKFLITMSDMGIVKDVQNEKLGNFGIDIKSMNIPLPSEAVGVGDSWSALNPNQSTTDLKMEMTIEKITTEEVFISVDQAMEDENTSVKGTYILDRNTGFTKSGEMEFIGNENGQSLKGIMKIKML